MGLIGKLLLYETFPQWSFVELRYVVLLVFASNLPIEGGIFVIIDGLIKVVPQVEFGLQQVGQII